MSNPLTITNLSHRYGKTPVFDNINLTVQAGEWLALLGGSGCGKSTLLRAIAGFVQPQKGSICMVSDGKQPIISIAKTMHLVNSKFQKQ